MQQDDIFQIFKQQLIEIIPELANKDIKINDSLKELGANSLDRAEVIIKVMLALNVQSPLVDFGQAKNIAELIGILQQKISKGTQDGYRN